MSNDWRSQAKERVKARQEGNTIKLTVGVNCLRVLPHKNDILPSGQLKSTGVMTNPVREFRTHRDVGPDKEFLACGHDVEGGGKCWLCDVMIPQLLKNPAKQAYADKMSSQDQFMVMASRFDTDVQKFTPAKPWWVSTGGRNSLSVRVHSKIAGDRKDYVHPVKGYNLNIEKTGEGLNTRYPSVEGDDAPSKVPLAILAALKPIEEYLPKYDEAEQKAAFYGKAREEEAPVEEETYEEAPAEEEQLESAEGELVEEEYVDPDAPAEEELTEEEPLAAEEEEQLEEYVAEEEPAEEEPAPPPPPRRPTTKPPAKPAPKVPPKPAPTPARKPAARR